MQLLLMLVMCVDDLFFQMQRTSDARKLYIPFYGLYTPADIVERAEFTSNYTYYTATSITFGRGDKSYERLFRLPLVPGGLRSDANIIVKITVGLDNDIRSIDSDPKFLISDGNHGIGFEFRDENSVHCRSIERTMGNNIAILPRPLDDTSYSANSLLPEEFILTLAPSQK